MSTSIVKGHLITRTDKATLIAQGQQEVWIPDSVVPYRNTQADGAIEMQVEDWFLAKHPEIEADLD
jgi:hypothetical protein